MLTNWVLSWFDQLRFFTFQWNLIWTTVWGLSLYYMHLLISIAPCELTQITFFVFNKWLISKHHNYKVIMISFHKCFQSNIRNTFSSFSNFKSWNKVRFIETSNTSFQHRNSEKIFDRKLWQVLKKCLNFNCRHIGQRQTETGQCQGNQLR